MATQTSIGHRGATRSHPARLGFRKLAAGLGIALVALLHTSAAPARTVATSGPVRFLDRTTWIMSHELVESLTDPEGNAIVGVSGTCEQSGWCEIADICDSTVVVSGVAVSTYWSEQADKCVAPDRATSATPHQASR
jgi:hypothetical protein